MLFHAFPTWLPGGFVGVDVFFVISGFLISTIIFRSLQKGDFNFTEFYAHRVKRIFPALVVVLAASYAFGWFALLPDEFKQLGKHMAAGAGFVQNLVLWQEAGYFDTESELKPLMHLWSLAIEEQFYLIYPVLVWVAWRLGFNVLGAVLLLALVSFGLNAAWIGQDAVKTFFVPQARFWELLAGALLAYAQFVKPVALSDWLKRHLFHPAIFKNPPPPARQGELLVRLTSVAGLLSIALALVVLDKDKAFPGWWALAPVVGAVLLIFSGPKAWVNQKILGNRLMVFVGVISYPLYLWHWPILSFARILESDLPSRGTRIAGVALSFLLAWLTYRLVERPIRFGPKHWAKTASLVGLLAVVGYAGFAAYQQDGLPARAVTAANPLVNTGQATGDQNWVVAGCGMPPELERKLGSCQHDKRGPATVFLLGDSKSASLAPGVFEVSGQRTFWRFAGGNGRHGAPVPVLSDAPIYARYQDMIRPALATLEQDREIRVVVITAATRALFQLNNDHSIDDLPASRNFDAALEGVDRVVGALIRSGKKVVMTVDNPTLKDPKKCISRVTALPALNRLLGLGQDTDCFIPYARHMELSRPYRALLERLRTKYPQDFFVFDPLDLLCDVPDGMCAMSKGGRLLYSYSDHISNYAAVSVAGKLVPFVEKIAEQ